MRNNIQKHSSAATLLIVAAVLLGTAFKCSTGTSAGDSDSFARGHKLVGRYSNSDGGIRSFTFGASGSFKRGGATSGSIRGGEYATGSTDSGTYDISGNTLSLSYDNGSSENLQIEVYDCCKAPDYASRSPGQIKINHVIYTNVD